MFYFKSHKRRRVAPFPWFGGKTRLISRLLPLFPNHRRYVSAFGGSAADIFGKPPSAIEVYNDINRDLYNFYAVLRDDSLRPKLYWEVEHTPIMEEQYASCLSVVQSSESDRVRRAWAFWYCTQFGYAGKDPAISTPGNYFVPHDQRLPLRWCNARQHLERLSRRFRTVRLECGPWQDVVAQYDAPWTLHYLDPTYLPETRASTDDYAHDMTEEDHVEMLNLLPRLKGYVMLSGYPSKLYDEHLHGWRKEEFSVICTVSPTRAQRTEAVWMNYDPRGMRLAV